MTEEPLIKHLLPRVVGLALILCPMVVAGFLLASAQALASEGGGPPEAPITGPITGECPPAPVAERVELCGTLNPHSNASTSYRWDYNAGASCRGGVETDTWETVSGEGIKEQLEVPYLLPDTYSYCLVACNEHGESAGQAVQFTTSGDCPAMWVHSGEEKEAVPGLEFPDTGPLDAPEEGQTLLGTIHLECGGTISYVFQYGPTTGPWSTTAPEELTVPPHSAPQVRADVTGLDPDTTYRYRLVATDGPYTAAGEEVQFTTPSSGEGLNPGRDPLETKGVEAPSPIAASPTPAVERFDAQPATATAELSIAGRARRLAMALKACQKKPPGERAKCKRWARREYAPAARKSAKAAREHRRTRHR